MEQPWAVGMFSPCLTRSRPRQRRKKIFAAPVFFFWHFESNKVRYQHIFTNMYVGSYNAAVGTNPIAARVPLHDGDTDIDHLLVNLHTYTIISRVRGPVDLDPDLDPDLDLDRFQIDRQSNRLESGRFPSWGGGSGGKSGGRSRRRRWNHAASVLGPSMWSRRLHMDWWMPQQLC